MFIHLLAMATGFAALSWEVIWQIKSTLALGVSAKGAALTLAVTMGGMSVGSLLMGHTLKNKPLKHPIRLYGALEIAIGVSGLLLGIAFQQIEKLDTWAYAVTPAAGVWVHIIGIAAVLGIPAICMGATLPVFGLISQQYRTSIAALYAFNTLGAAAGTLIVAFLLIPAAGVTHACWIIAAVNGAIGILTFLLPAGKAVRTKQTGQGARSRTTLGPVAEQWVVVVTGFATCALEIAWFRSLTAAFQSTTAAFAIMLSAVLIALGVAGSMARSFRQGKIALGSLLSWAGILILLATPFIERFDLLLQIPHRPLHAESLPPPVFSSSSSQMMLSYAFMVSGWFVKTLSVVGPPIFLLGIALPWILDDQRSARRWGVLYALNTVAAIAGALGAAWLLLPAVGFARTARITGILVVIAGVIIAPRKRRLPWGALGIAALLIAILFETGVGKTRAQGYTMYGSASEAKLLESFDGPEATTSVIAYNNGGRILLIDGASATGQSAQGDIAHEHYMPWMGRLPMLLHANPKNALVICFGTGQTANAVRNENPLSLDIVDINPNVFKLAHNFDSNQGVLNDPRVKPLVMDGRAYMRRTTKTYDVITLEPMPPTFAGVNALYSREFYELARERLGKHGIIAQWLPFHAVSPPFAIAIAKTFQEVFPNSILWLDPVSKNGILLGSKDDKDQRLGMDWPGFTRPDPSRDLSEDEVKKAIVFDQNGLWRYSESGETITDDNQLLAYGKAVYAASFVGLREENFDLMSKIKDGGIKNQ